MAEDEVLVEVDAVQAVYGDDCIVLETYPPHLHVHIKPRTAEISFQQFVEAVLGIRAGPRYPREPPSIHIIESKGLDEQRQNHLVTGIQEKASELTSCLMLVSLFEEAVDMLSSMNHPDGNCPLCLYPLVEEDAGGNKLPFMKLMSCYHCFHCECILSWWNWLQSQDYPTKSSGVSVRASRNVVNKNGTHATEVESTGGCPVCRKIFHAKDIEHVLDLVGANSQLSSNDTTEVNEDENLLQSDSEKLRREKFEAILKLQQENSGLIEPKRNEVLLPGMFLPRSIPQPTTFSANETTEQPSTVSEKQPEDHIIPLVTNSIDSSHRPSTSEHRNSGTRKHRGRSSRKQVKQWIKKENGNAD